MSQSCPPIRGFRKLITGSVIGLRNGWIADNTHAYSCHRVHAKGGSIFMQLWHMGRQSHSSYQPGKVLPVAPSAIAVGQGQTNGEDGKKYDYEVGTTTSGSGAHETSQSGGKSELIS